MKKAEKKWTYSGIKQFFPNLPFTEWLDICKRKDHLCKDKDDVVIRVNWRKR